MTNELVILVGSVYEKVWIKDRGKVASIMLEST